MVTRIRKTLGLTVIIVVVVVLCFVWWQDRPLVEAETLLRSNDAPAALKQLNAFLTDHPTHQRALLQKARTLVALEQWSEANQLFAQTGASTRDELEAWSTALLNQQRWLEAFPILEQLKDFDGRDATVLHNLTVCQYQLGHTQQALKNAAELASLPGHELEGVFYRGVIFRSMGDTHLAIENWDQIKKLSPNGSGLPVPPAEFFRIFAQDLIWEGRPRQATVYFQRSLEAQSSVDVLAWLGDAQYSSGQEPAAKATWEDALQHDKQNARARLGLAELALRQSDATLAIQLLEPNRTSQQEVEDTAYLLQRAYTLLGNDEAATNWQHKVAMIRKSQKLQAAFNDETR